MDISWKRIITKTKMKYTVLHPKGCYSSYLCRDGMGLQELLVVVEKMVNW